MQFQLTMGLVITALVVLYVYLKKTKSHQEINLPKVSEPNLPAISEDVNLPAIKNELENNGSQQQ